jgi:hypothetical protein
LRADAEPVYLERTVVSDDPLSGSGRDKFLAVASERGQELLTELDTFLTQISEPDKSVSGKRYGVGIYFFEDESTGQIDREPRRLGGQPGAQSGRPTEEIDVLAARPGKE